MAATKAYDRNHAWPGNEAFRRFLTIEYKPGNFRVTHLPRHAEADEDEPDIPYWIAKRGGGGTSGAPLPPAPAPDQLPHSQDAEAAQLTQTAAHTLPFGETRATFPSEPTPSQTPAGLKGSRPKSEACLDVLSPAGEPHGRRERTTAAASRRRRRRA